LYDLADAYQKAGREGDRVRQEQLGADLDRAFSKAGGEVFKTLREAKAYAYRRAREAQATGLRFEGQVQAYRAAPQIVPRQQRLQAMAEALSGVRKVAILSEPNDAEVLIVDLQEKLMPNLYDVGPLQEQTKP
jgi:regulator of protease activity HflC (stomatin/prohibitin superfamily)